jgi:hypothetical protein
MFCVYDASVCAICLHKWWASSRLLRQMCCKTQSLASNMCLVLL